MKTEQCEQGLNFISGVSEKYPFLTGYDHRTLSNILKLDEIHSQELPNYLSRCLFNLLDTFFVNS